MSQDPTLPRLEITAPDQWLKLACEIALKAREVHLRSGQKKIGTPHSPLEIIDPHYPKVTFQVRGSVNSVTVNVIEA